MVAVSSTFLISHSDLFGLRQAWLHARRGIAFEEHDLIQSLGVTYTAYRARVPALIPRPSRAKTATHMKGTT